VPEGDTVWRTAAALRQRVLGSQLSSAHPPALAALEGRRLEGVETLGKHLLLRFQDLWLHTHLGMHGAWYLHRPGERWRRPAHQARAVLEFGDWVAVCFRPLLVEVTRRPALSHLGPDLLSAELSLEEVVARARAVGPVTLGELLLDQRVCSGIGNVYRCEALWELGYDPWRSSAETSDAELRQLFQVAREAMLGNLGAGRRRFAGGRPPAVHGRAGRPCPRCGVSVRVRRLGEQARPVYYCPGCQGSDGDDSARGLDHPAHGGQVPRLERRGRIGHVPGGDPGDRGVE
jgi:endonuclease-8